MCVIVCESSTTCSCPCSSTSLQARYPSYLFFCLIRKREGRMKWHACVLSAGERLPWWMPLQEMSSL